MTTCDKCDGFCPTILIPPLKKAGSHCRRRKQHLAKTGKFPAPPWAAANGGTRIIWRPEIGVPPVIIHRWDFHLQYNQFQGTSISVQTPIYEKLS